MSCINENDYEVKLDKCLLWCGHFFLEKIGLGIQEINTKYLMAA